MIEVELLKAVYHVVIVMFVDMTPYVLVLSFVMENDPEFITLYLPHS